MVIVNQSRDEILNFDNVMNIVATNCDEDGFGIFAGVVIGIDDNYRLLGYYKTEERAKEIIKDIADYYSRANFKNQVDARIAMPLIFARQYSEYVMPKE